MKRFAPFDRRPVLVAVAGPNGAGKTTFYHSHLEAVGLRFVNADVFAGELDLDPYTAAKVADTVRRQLLNRGESFIFETVFSDPAGDKLRFLKEAVGRGYTVVLCYIGIATPKLSEERVAMRVSQGGHDVPGDKLKSRFPRSLANLRRAIHELPHVLIYENSDLRRPFREVVVFEKGRCVRRSDKVPAWLAAILK